MLGVGKGKGQNGEVGKLLAAKNLKEAAKGNEIRKQMYTDTTMS